MNKKRILKKGIEKTLELISISNLIMMVFSIIFMVLFKDIKSIYNYYVMLFIINNIIVLVNGDILIKYTKKYSIIFK